MGYREQAMDSGVRPAREEQQVAGPARAVSMPSLLMVWCETCAR